MAYQLFVFDLSDENDPLPVPLYYEIVISFHLVMNSVTNYAESEEVGPGYIK